MMRVYENEWNIRFGFNGSSFYGYFTMEIGLGCFDFYKIEEVLVDYKI